MITNFGIIRGNDFVIYQIVLFDSKHARPRSGQKIALAPELALRPNQLERAPLRAPKNLEQIPLHSALRSVQTLLLIKQ